MNINFKLEILANFEVWERQSCQRTVHRITKFHSHFQLKSEREGKTGYVWQGIHSNISKQLLKNKNISIIVSFYGFKYQILVTQAMSPLQCSQSFLFRIKSIIKGSVHFFLLVESSSEISEVIDH